MVGDGIRAEFAVSDSGETLAPNEDEKALVEQANTLYAAYVRDQTDQLLTKTQEFTTAFAAGDFDRARELYAPARVHWERIETVAESFGDLDPEMDAREADLEPGQKWTGWHRIEKDLWPERAEGYTPMTEAERTEYADNLLANTDTLYKRTRDMTFTADQIANGAKGLLDEVATGKVTGEEEYWSRTDLWDFQANVDGARVAFDGLKPLLQARGETALMDQIQAKFTALQTLLGRAQGGRRLRHLRHADPRAGQAAVRRGERPVRAPVQAHRRGDLSLFSERNTTSDVDTGAEVGPRGDASRRGGDHPWRVPARAPRRRRGRGGRDRTRGRRRWRTQDRKSGGSAEPAPHPVDRAYPFYGDHQAGIVTPAQDRLHFAAFDVITDDRDELIGLLRDWTAAAARMTQGLDAGEMGATSGSYDAPPDDTGEAIGLPPSGLTLTFGFGPSLFRHGRQGPVRARRPATEGAAAAAALPGRQPGPGEVRRRPVRAGLRRRSAGGGARHPQPGPDRLRPGVGALVPAGLRAYVVDLDRAEHPPEPVRLQGRHRQPQGRGDRDDRRARLGAARARTARRTGWRAGAIWWLAGST